MLDLEKLEKKLDDALLKETPETLKEWLKEQRDSNILTFFGIGKFEPIASKPYSYYQATSYNIKYTKASDNDPSEKLIDAA